MSDLRDKLENPHCAARSSICGSIDQACRTAAPISADCFIGFYHMQAWHELMGVVRPRFLRVAGVPDSALCSDCSTDLSRFSHQILPEALHEFAKCCTRNAVRETLYGKRYTAKLYTRNAVHETLYAKRYTAKLYTAKRCTRNSVRKTLYANLCTRNAVHETIYS